MSERHQERLDEILALAPVIPVLTVDTPAQAVEMVSALVRGGLPVVELTLRTPSAEAAIEAVIRSCPQAVVGAGTVNAPAQLEAVAALGVAFAVSPGTSPGLVEAIAASGVPFLPGVATASEAMTLAERGHRNLKFFPAEASGGVPALRSLAAPLAGLKFCPTGGIDVGRALAYLACPNVACVGGSWITPGTAVRAGDWDTVERLAADAVALAG